MNLTQPLPWRLLLAAAIVRGRTTTCRKKYAANRRDVISDRRETFSFGKLDCFAGYFRFCVHALFT
jgi:hypothetical protein